MEVGRLLTFGMGISLGHVGTELDIVLFMWRHLVARLVFVVAAFGTILGFLSSLPSFPC